MPTEEDWKSLFESMPEPEITPEVMEAMALEALGRQYALDAIAEAKALRPEGQR
jgi:hypothetical protein